jgi:peptide/nickel transport system substrate-binding protein
MRPRNFALLGSLLVVAALAVTGCGGDSSSAKKGGEVTILDVQGGVDSLDPGYWYYQTDYMELGQTTQRQLYGWPAEATSPEPDLAAGAPKLSQGGKTITVKIKPGIKYAPPLDNRTVKTADIKYAIERCFLPQVGNGYANVYYSDIVGVKEFQDGSADDVSGIETPDDATLVIKTNKPVAVIQNANALALPCTTPVPKDLAQKYDKGKQSTYGDHAAQTGPYMIEGSDSGTVPKSGYSPGKTLVLVRNPSWDKKTDFRPANFDKITVKGGSDITVASDKILDGQSLMSGDFAAPPTPVLKKGVTGSQKDLFDIHPSQSLRYIALNSKKPPLDDVNFRRAVAAVTDREQLRLTRGGESIGIIANHFIPPEMPGFDEAGGEAGPGLDFYKNPSGDVELAKEYLKKAGYKNGMYDGPKLTMIGDNSPPASNTGEAFQDQLKKIGIELDYRQVPHEAMLSRFCQVPKSQPHFCPNLGWGKDFFDSQSMLDPTFNGKNIVPSGNTNNGLSDDPKLNKMLDDAAQITDPAERAKAYGEADRYSTSQVYYVYWLWDNQVNFASDDVNGVVNKFNSSWDLTFSSLKE